MVSKSLSGFQYHVIVVDDDERIRTLLAKFLAKNGCSVITADSIEKLKKALKIFIVDLIVLDNMMENVTGIEFLEEFRKTNQTTPVIMLTAMGENHERIKGLQVGADDYIVKPFEPMELLLRINNIFRRSFVEHEVGEVFSVEFGAGYEFFLKSGELRKEGKIQRLSHTELLFLQIFANNVNNPVDRDTFNLYGINSFGRSIDVQVNRLRKRFEQDVKTPRIFQTVRSTGYRMIGTSRYRVKSE